MNWVFDSESHAAKAGLSGVEFQRRLGKRLVEAAEAQRRRESGPDEVVHRTVDGRTVIARRLQARRCRQ